MNIKIIDLIVFSFACVRYIMILESLKLPEKILGIIKKTESDWLRMFLAKAGMFFDCPACNALIASGLVLVANSLNHTINVFMAISVLGLFLKKKTVN